MKDYKPRHLVGAAFFFLLIATISCNRPSGVGIGKSMEAPHPLVGQPAPEVVTKALDGETFKLSADGAGQIVLLDFWATWCGPCVIELPILMRLADEFRDQGVKLYGVNVGEDEETIREFLAENKWPLEVVLDPSGEAAQSYVVEGIPQLVLIDRLGRVQQVHIGYSPDIESKLRLELQTMIRSMPQQPTKTEES